MLSTAAAGSVSDATKGSPSFSLTHVSVNPTDATQSNTVAPGVEVLADGEATSEIRMAHLQAAGNFGWAIMHLVASIGSSDAGGRAADNPYAVGPTIVNGVPAPQVVQVNFDGNPDTDIGFFQPAGIDPSTQEEDPHMGTIDGSSKSPITANSTTNLLLASMHLFMAPHVNSNEITFASGIYEIPNNCITMRDEFTGVETIGPTDGPFSFKVKLIP